MKRKIFLIGISLLSFAITNAQNDLDALRVSQNFYGGTARFQSMGGAFGALGGDFSSLTTNPAGLGVYRSSELVFTPTLMKNVTETDYLGSNTEDFEFNFNINNFGYVAHFGTNSAGWKGFNLGFGFNRLNNFHQNMIIQTPSANGSLLDEFILTANSLNDPDLPAPSYYYEGMALAAEGIFLYDPISRETYVGNDDEINNIPYYTDLQYMNDFTFYATVDDNDLIYGQSLKKSFFNQGKLSEFVISGAGNYNDQLYIGATFGIQRYYYENTVIHRESTVGSEFEATYNPNDRVYFESFNFQENNITWGTGVNFKFGVIYKPINMLRLGVAIHTPTMQKMESEFSTKMETYFRGVYEPISGRSDLAVNEYKIYTPFKALGSIGIQIQKVALISVDYEYMDYGNMRFKSDNESFDGLNNSISDSYKATHNIRAGAEIRLGNFMIRGGVAYYDSPYSSSSYDFKTMLYSGGVGLNYKAVKFDVGYVMVDNEYESAPYISSEMASVNSVSNRFVSSIAFRF